jgi:ribosomal protein S20
LVVCRCVIHAYKHHTYTITNLYTKNASSKPVLRCSVCRRLIHAYTHCDSRIIQKHKGIGKQNYCVLKAHQNRVFKAYMCTDIHEHTMTYTHKSKNRVFEAYKHKHYVFKAYICTHIHTHKIIYAHANKRIASSKPTNTNNTSSKPYMRTCIHTYLQSHTHTQAQKLHFEAYKHKTRGFVHTFTPVQSHTYEYSVLDDNVMMLARAHSPYIQSKAHTALNTKRRARLCVVYTWAVYCKVLCRNPVVLSSRMFPEALFGKRHLNEQAVPACLQPIRACRCLINAFKYH